MERNASVNLQRDATKLGEIPGLENGEMFHVTYSTALKSKQDKEIEEARKQREADMDPNNINKMGLRHIKKNWTLNDYISEVNKKKIVIKTQKYPVCAMCAIDSAAAQAFQIYLREMAFQQQRMGFLYGTTTKGRKPHYQNDNDEQDDSDEDSSDEEKDSAVMDTTKHDFKNVQCAVIYEPNQQGDLHGVIEMQDEYADRAEQLAQLLGMQRVGWVFSHSGQDREHPLTNNDIVRMAEMQAKYGESFVTVVVSPNEKMQAKFEAFQVSKQCVELYKKGLLEVDPDNKKVLKTKVPVESERKLVQEVDILLFIVNVPIQNTQSIFQVGFPQRNRPHLVQSMEKLKEMLMRRASIPFVQRVTDFHLLLFLTDYLSLTSDFPTLCEAIKTKNNSKAQGYEHLIGAYAGLM